MNLLAFTLVATTFLQSPRWPPARSDGHASQEASTSLVASKWVGEMSFQGHLYPFSLAITQVEPSGHFVGQIFWKNERVASAVRGEAKGNHLVFTDDDGDTKDVLLEGKLMTGTDKGGTAHFEAVLQP